MFVDRESSDISEISSMLYVFLLLIAQHSPAKQSGVYSEGTNEDKYFFNCNLKPNEGWSGGGINIPPAAAAYWWGGVVFCTTPEGL